jgi:AraC-like DNA-binding protein
MSNQSKKLKLINNPQDFKQEFLCDNSPCFCDTAGGKSTKPDRNFFEVVTLEKLKVLQKKKSFDASRRNFYTIVLVTGGKVKETIGCNSYTFEANTLYFIPENQLHTIVDWSRDVKGFHCIFDADYFLLCLRSQVKLNHYPFFQPDKEVFMKIADTEAAIVIDLFKKMNFEYCARKTGNDDLLVRLYLNVLLIELERIYQHKQSTESIHVPKRQQLVTGFRKLVSQHYLQKRKVAEYAALLYVTPHYLNDTVKEITGRSASEFIQEELLTEAKSHLIQTDDNVTQIAATLNFSDQSYFCRFFKKHTGFSPKQFRENHFHLAG